MSEAVVRFAKELGEWLSKRFKSEKPHVALYQEYKPRSAIEDGHVANVAREVAENRLDIANAAEDGIAAAVICPLIVQNANRP